MSKHGAPSKSCDFSKLRPHKIKLIFDWPCFAPPTGVRPELTT